LAAAASPGLHPDADDAGDGHVLLGLPPEHGQANPHPEGRGREGDAARAPAAAPPPLPRAGPQRARQSRLPAASAAEGSARRACAPAQRQLRDLDGYRRFDPRRLPREDEPFFFLFAPFFAPRDDFAFRAPPRFAADFFFFAPPAFRFGALLRAAFRGGWIAGLSAGSSSSSCIGPGIDDGPGAAVGCPPIPGLATP